MTTNVQQFCERLWEAREESRLPSAPIISRGLAVAVAADVTACEDYEPHVDLRVVWAQAMVKGRVWLAHEAQPEASEPVEATVAYLLGKDFPEPLLSGKALAAGERTSNIERPTSNLEGIHSFSNDQPSTLNPQLL